MRWSTAVDDAFLRHEERIRYESGAVLELVSYLTWSEAESAYKWTLALAPGRVLQLNGSPDASGKTVTWEFADNQGGLCRTTWTLDGDRFTVKDARLDMGAWVETGGATAKRTAAEPGDAILETDPAPPGEDEASVAAREGLASVSFLRGAWKLEGETVGGKLSGESSWRVRMGGTVLEHDVVAKRPDGPSRERWFLVWNSAEKKLVVVAFVAQGRILVLNGTREDDTITFDVNGARCVWKIASSKKQIRFSVDVPTGTGVWKTVENGTETREEEDE
jgi:hypothetical protein